MLGVPEPLGTPAALANNTDAGGVFRMNVKLLSYTSEEQICGPSQTMPACLRHSACHVFDVCFAFVKAVVMSIVDAAH